MISKIADNYSPVYSMHYSNRQLQPVSFNGDIGKIDAPTQALNRQAIANKVATSSGIALALAISTDFIFCKGKHVKNLLGKLKRNKVKPEIKPDVKPEIKAEVEHEANHITSEVETRIKSKKTDKPLPTTAQKHISKHKIKPIENDEEYYTVLNRLKQKEEWGDNLYGWYKNPLISLENIQNYPTCQDIEKGVIAYAGYSDIHIALNSYLSGRKLPWGFSEQMGEDFTKLVDYSLKDMDKTFTPYNGITYRIGFFDPKVKQYYSTSKSPKTFPYGNKDGQHTMFVSKRGHDIEAFQKAKNTSDRREIFIREQEVLMDISADYRELVDLTPELIKKRLEYAKTILTERKEPLTKENIRKIISEIKVYEEI